MNADEINFAIAEHLGIPTREKKWRFQYTYEGTKGISGGHGSKKEASMQASIAARVYCGPCTDPEEYEDWAPIPDFYGDLNAMHEAEKTMSDDLTDRFRQILMSAMLRFSDAISATAAQRAEAFLRTVGKWS